MLVYFAVLISVYILTSQAEASDFLIKSNLEESEVAHTPTSKFLFILASLVLIIVAGLRYWVGTDYGSYYVGYMNWANNLIPALKEFNEPGYPLIATVAVRLGGAGALSIFLASLITIALAMRTAFRNTMELKNMVLLYLFLGCWSAAFNAVRQCLAAAVVFTGYRYIREQKLIKYAFVVFAAYLFHKSALLLILPFFFVTKKLTSRSIVLMGIGTVASLYSYQLFFGVAEDLLDHVYGTAAYYTQFVNILRVLVGVLPAIYLTIEFWKERHDEQISYNLYFILLHGFINIITINSAYLARLTIYTAPFAAIGMAELFNRLAKRRGKLIVSMIMFFFLLFWLYELFHSSSLNPYRFIF